MSDAIKSAVDAVELPERAISDPLLDSWNKEPDAVADTVSAADAVDTVPADDAQDTVATGDDTVVADAADDTLAGDDKPADTVPADTNPEPVAPASAVAVDDPAKVIAKAQEDYNAAYQSMKAAEADMAKVEDDIEKLSDDDLPTAGMLKKQTAAKRAIAVAQSKMQEARQLYAQGEQQQATYQQQQNQQYWSAWQKTSGGLTAAEGEKLFIAEYEALAKQYPGRDVSIAAIERTNAKAKAIVAGKKAHQKPEAKPAIRPTGKPSASGGSVKINDSSDPLAGVTSDTLKGFGW